MILLDWARRLKRDALTVWLAARDARTPWWVKALALAVAAYAFSPIDLIPDFIPVLGLLDDVIIVPLGILAVSRLVPAEVWRDSRAAAEVMAERPTSRVAAIIVVLIWLAALALCAGLLLPLLRQPA